MRAIFNRQCMYRALCARSACSMRLCKQRDAPPTFKTHHSASGFNWETLLSFLLAFFCFHFWSTSGQLELRFFFFVEVYVWYWTLLESPYQGLFSTALGLYGGRASGYYGPHRAKEVTGVNLVVARHTNEKAICPEY